MYCNEFDTGFDVFRSNKIYSEIFRIMNMTNIDGKHSKPPYLHVKHKNTRKTGTKWSKIHFFSDRQNIENSSEVG